LPACRPYWQNQALTANPDTQKKIPAVFQARVGYSKPRPNTGSAQLFPLKHFTDNFIYFNSERIYRLALKNRLHQFFDRLLFCLRF